MNSLRKVLIVDNGNRASPDLLSIELAELGVSTVTVSFEATDDVLDVIEVPSAIFVKLPQSSRDTGSGDVLRFADHLRRQPRISGIPVMVWEGTSTLGAGSIAEILRTKVGPHALAEAEV